MTLSLIAIILTGVIVGIISIAILRSKKSLIREEFDMKYEEFYFEMGLHDGHQRNLLIRNTLYMMYTKDCDNLVGRHFDIQFAYRKLMQNEAFLEKMSFYHNPVHTYQG